MHMMPKQSHILDENYNRILKIVLKLSWRNKCWYIIIIAFVVGSAAAAAASVAVVLVTVSSNIYDSLLIMNRHCNRYNMCY